METNLLVPVVVQLILKLIFQIINKCDDTHNDNVEDGEDAWDCHGRETQAS